VHGAVVSAFCGRMLVEDRRSRAALVILSSRMRDILAPPWGKRAYYRFVAKDSAYDSLTPTIKQWGRP
jgi:hypothetical protein